MGTSKRMIGMHRLLLSLQAKRMIVLQLLLLSLQNNVDARGCTKEPGYFASGDSIQGYAGISMKHADDCAIKCAGVLGCVGWTFNHQKENRELTSERWSPPLEHKQSFREESDKS